MAAQPIVIAGSNNVVAAPGPPFLPYNIAANQTMAGPVHTNDHAANANIGGADFLSTLGIDFPFNAHFEPTDNFAMTFSPHDGDAFDAYNISGIEHALFGKW